LLLNQPRKPFQRSRQRGLDCFASLRKPVQKACPVEVAQARDARGIRLRFEFAPRGKLGQRNGHVFETRRGVGPRRFGENFVRPQLQPVLPLGRGEYVHDAAVERCLVGAHMPEEVGGIDRCGHRRLGSWLLAVVG
jgi:hypothetical protein